MSRITTIGVVLVASAFLILSVFETSVVNSNDAEACGVKLVVKANKKPRKRLRAKARKRVIKSSETRLAKRRPVDSKKNNRTRVAAGAGTTQARTPTNTANRGNTNKARTRTIGAGTTTTTPAPKAETRKPVVRKETPKAETRTATKAPVEKKVTKPRVAKTEMKPIEAKPERKKRVKPSSSPAFSTEVYFDYNSDEVNSDAASALDAVVEYLRDNPNARLSLFGYTDPAGSSGYNQRLSRRRALAVKNHIIEKAGVSSKQLLLKARGERDMAYPEDSPKNRRVVVKNR